jgi:hypothetical protein
MKKPSKRMSRRGRLRWCKRRCDVAADQRQKKSEGRRRRLGSWLSKQSTRRLCYTFRRTDGCTVKIGS